MKAKSIIAVSLIAVGSFTAQVNAQELSLERVAAQFINQAMISTAHEVEMGVKHAVANTAYLFDLDGDNIVGHVEVTELAANRADAQRPDSQIVTTRIND